MAIPLDVQTAAPPAATISSTAIAAADVVKAYPVGGGWVEILHGVSLQVEFGEMVAVMGPSGSGKSTLLYCLAGLEAPNVGSVTLLGKGVHELSRADLARMRRQDVGFVFQSYNLIPTLSAFENVALPYRLRRAKPPADLIEETFRLVGLADRMKASPPSMSGGEQQRVALARVLAQRPKVVFADEPTGALDTRSGELVLNELTGLAHQPDQCVLVVTHDPRVAARCDRVLFMKDGLLVRELRHADAEEVATTLAGLAARPGGDS